MPDIVSRLLCVSATWACCICGAQTRDRGLLEKIQRQAQVKGESHSKVLPLVYSTSVYVSLCLKFYCLPDGYTVLRFSIMKTRGLLFKWFRLDLSRYINQLPCDKREHIFQFACRKNIKFKIKPEISWILREFKKIKHLFMFIQINNQFVTFHNFIVSDLLYFVLINIVEDCIWSNRQMLNNR